MDTDRTPTAGTAVPRVHPGERRLQQLAGLTRTDWGSAGTDARIPEVAAAFLAQQRLVAIAAADDAGHVWTSAITGPPGFVRADDETTVRSTRSVSAADPLHGSLAHGRSVGLLFIEPPTRRRMRVNGRVAGTGDDLVVRTEQVYANCPKYIHSRAPDEHPPADRRATPVPVRTGALSPAQTAWIERADTFFTGSIADPYGADASHRGGAPGFVVATSTTITWPEYVGNSMYMTLGNLELDPRCGLLFIDWEGGHTLQVTGRAVTDRDPERLRTFPEARAIVDLEVEAVVEIRGHLDTAWSGGDPWRSTPPPPQREAGGPTGAVGSTDRAAASRRRPGPRVSQAATTAAKTVRPVSAPPNSVPDDVADSTTGAAKPR